MSLTAWALIGTVAAGAASVLSLFVVAYQIRALAQQTRELARQTETSTQAIFTATYTQVITNQIEQDRFFAEHPELRRYLYGDNRWFRNKNRHRAEATVEMFVDMVDLSIVLQDKLPYDMTGLWREYVTDLMRQSPHLRAYWKESRAWYNTDVQNFFDGCLNDAVNSISYKNPRTDGGLRGRVRRALWTST